MINSNDCQNIVGNVSMFADRMLADISCVVFGCKSHDSLAFVRELQTNLESKLTFYFFLIDVW